MTNSSGHIWLMWPNLSLLFGAYYMSLKWGMYWTISPALIAYHWMGYRRTRGTLSGFLTDDPNHSIIFQKKWSGPLKNQLDLIYVSVQSNFLFFHSDIKIRDNPKMRTYTVYRYECIYVYSFRSGRWYFLLLIWYYRSAHWLSFITLWLWRPAGCPLAIFRVSFFSTMVSFWLTVTSSHHA